MVFSSKGIPSTPQHSGSHIQGNFCAHWRRPRIISSMSSGNYSFVLALCIAPEPICDHFVTIQAYFYITSLYRKHHPAFLCYYQCHIFKNLRLVLQAPLGHLHNQATFQPDMRSNLFMLVSRLVWHEPIS